MNDTNDQYVHSPSSSSSSSSSSNRSINFKLKPSISKTSIIHRRSKRLQTNLELLESNNSLSKTNLDDNDLNNQLKCDTNEKQISTVRENKYLFTTPTSINSKSSYWTVTDRQTEWYRLSIPINESLLNKKNRTVPYKQVSNTIDRNKSSSNIKDRIKQPTDVTQLIMKSVMNELDYDMDDDDMKFLYELNHYNRIKRKRQISEEEFENAIIILEFATAEKIRSHLKQKTCEDENIVCDICLLPDGDDGNEMVFCERCNCCVHQNCYGIPVLPSGTWFCTPCSILRRPACILCPKLGGPMKCTSSGTIWCHLTCALWLPELTFVDYAKMEPVLNLNKIPHARWSLRCVVCSTSEGACVQCAHKNCRTPFHVTCGLSAGYFLDVEQTSSKVSSAFRSQFNAYCFKHSDEARKRSEHNSSTTLSNKNSNESSSSKLTIPLSVYHRDQLKKEKWLIECYRKFATFISSSHLHEECPNGYDEKLSKKIYDYWLNKRQLNKAMPLIKRIDFVFQQRENSELLISQINNCLNTREKILQLKNRCKSIFDSSKISSTTLTHRLESLKKAFSTSIHRRSSTKLHLLRGKNDKKIKLSKNSHRKLTHSTKQNKTIEKVKQCIVTLESTHRHSLQLNKTYLIGKTIDGKMTLLPKQFIEQTNVIVLNDNDNLQQKTTDFPPIDYSDTFDSDDNVDSSKDKGTFTTTKTAYTSQGNVVTCVTGSFH